MFRGTSEPMLIACALWAIDRHLDRRYGWAFVLGVGSRADAPRGLAAADRLRGMAVVALGIDADAGARRARAVLAAVLLVRTAVGGLGAAVPGCAARRGVQRRAWRGIPASPCSGAASTYQTIPVLVFAVLAVVLAWVRQPRDRLTLALGGRRARVVDRGGRDDPRRLSGAGAVLPAGGRRRRRAGRCRDRAAGRDGFWCLAARSPVGRSRPA